MNKIFIEGRLGKNAEVKETSNGKKYVRLTMAVNWRKNKDDDRTTWYDVISFNPAYTGNIVQYLTTGKVVIVMGDLEPELNTGKDGKTYLNMTVRASSIEFPKFMSKQDEPSNNSKQTEEIPDDDTLTTMTMPSQHVKPSITQMENINSSPAINQDDDDLPF